MFLNQYKLPITIGRVNWNLDSFINNWVTNRPITVILRLSEISNRGSPAEWVKWRIITVFTSHFGVLILNTLPSVWRRIFDVWKSKTASNEYASTWCSVQAWRCSLCIRGQSWRDWRLLWWTGVFPTDVRGLSSKKSYDIIMYVPRRCGGDPSEGVLHFMEWKCSLRMWGWFLAWRHCLIVR